MGSLPRELSTGVAFQVFTPSRVQAVTATEAWTPGASDRVFMATVEQGVKISGGTEFVLGAHVPLGIVAGLTYTFSVSSTILVM